MFKKKFLLLASVSMLFKVSFAFAENKDPTEPANYSSDSARTAESEAITHFVLDAVIISGDKKLAIINNKIVKVGDKIGDSTIKTIEANHVVLISEQGELTLNLFGNPIKESKQ